MAATIVIEDLGDMVKISGLGTAPSKITYPKNSTTYVRQNTGVSGSEEYFRLYSNGIGRTVDLKASEILTPTVADADALEGVLESYFFNSASTTTYSVLLADIANGKLKAGRWVFVSDICDQGAWFVCTSPTTISSEGYGLFLNCDENIEPTADWSRLNIKLNFTVSSGTFTVGDNLTSSGNSWTGAVVSKGTGVMEVLTTSFITAPGVYPLAAHVITNGVATLNVATVTMPATPYLPLAESKGRWHRQSEGFTVDGDSLTFRIGFDQVSMTGAMFALGDTLTEGAWSGDVIEVGDNYALVLSASALGTYPAIGNTVDNGGGSSAEITDVYSAFSVDDAVVAPSGFEGAVVYVSGMQVSMAAYNGFPVPQPTIGEIVSSSSGYDMVVASVGDLNIHDGDVFIDFDVPAGRFRHYQCVDVATINTGSPSTSSTATWRPLPIEVGFGYLSVSNWIDFDLFHTDAITGKGWLTARRDSLTEIRYGYDADFGFTDFSASPVLAYRWGKKEWKGIRAEGFVGVTECYLVEINGLATGYRSFMQLPNSVGAVLSNAVIGANANVFLQIAEGKSINGLTVAPKVDYQGQTFTENVERMVITRSQTTARSLAFAADSPAQVVIEVSSDQLKGTALGENIDTGITLLANGLHKYHGAMKMRIEITPDVTPFSAGPMQLLVVDQYNNEVKGISVDQFLISAQTVRVVDLTDRIAFANERLTLICSDDNNPAPRTPFSGGDCTAKIIVDFIPCYL